MNSCTLISLTADRVTQCFLELQGQHRYHKSRRTIKGGRKEPQGVIRPTPKSGPRKTEVSKHGKSRILTEKSKKRKIKNQTAEKSKMKYSEKTLAKRKTARRGWLFLTALKWSPRTFHRQNWVVVAVVVVFAISSCRVLTLMYMKQEIMCVMCKMLQLLSRHSLWFM